MEARAAQRFGQNQHDQGESDHRAKTVKERTAISAQVVYDAILSEGEEELRRSTSALGFSGLAAGLSMGFSFLTQGLLQGELPDTPASALIAKLGYAIGFLIVILGRQQLFTENTLTPIIPLLKHKKWITFWNTMRLWSVVFFANWLGTIIIAWVFAKAEIMDESTRSALLQIANHAMSHSFGLTVVRGIFAGWLIAMLVWLLPFAETGRVAVIILMTYVIALGSFTHVVAGSVDTFYLVALGIKTWGQYLLSFMLPTLCGNVLGGVALVAALNHAQVTAGNAPASEND